VAGHRWGPLRRLPQGLKEAHPAVPLCPALGVCPSLEDDAALNSRALPAADRKGCPTKCITAPYQPSERYQIREEVQQIICTDLPRHNSRAGGLYAVPPADPNADGIP
jgi:hypothetical protein